MSKFRKVLFLSGLVLAVAAPATSQAGVNLDFRYLPTYTVPMGTGSTGGFNFLGGAAGVEFMFGSHVGLRLGAGYQQRALNGGTLSAINAPLDLNIYFVRWLYLSVGGVVDYNLTGPAGFKSYDIGVAGGLGFDIPIGSHFAIELGGKYVYNFISVVGTTQPNDIEGFAGFKIMFGAK
ncbi:MAG: hypothetical protein ACXVBW_04090 [Bdellovibrionota bacterium]